MHPGQCIVVGLSKDGKQVHPFVVDERGGYSNAAAIIALHAESLTNRARTRMGAGRPICGYGLPPSFRWPQTDASSEPLISFQCAGPPINHLDAKRL